MVRLKVLKPKKEYIYARKAIKDHVCHECKGTIPKGAIYIEDHINYARRKSRGEGFLWYTTNAICLLCWRGEIPKELGPLDKVFEEARDETFHSI